MKIHVYFLDEDRQEIELDLDELLEAPNINFGFLTIAFADKSTRMINTSLISEITTG